MNWFIGLTVNPRGWYPDRIERPPPGFTAFHPDDLHLTVAFLGRASEERARAAWAALSWPLGAFNTELGDVVPMGAPGRYSALSLTLGRGREEIEEAIGLVRNVLCSTAGAETDTRPPKAHVTIARPKRSAPKSVRRGGLEWARAVSVAGTPIVLDKIALYAWALDRKTRLFRTVEQKILQSSREQESDSPM